MADVSVEVPLHESVTPTSNMDVHFSSVTCLWNTPQDFYNILDEEFNFTLDPCCLPHTAKCDTFFTPETNGLVQDWGGHSVFVNPPYGRDMLPWIIKGYEESQKENTKVVMLIPARTDTQWFHDYCVRGEIRLLKGRLKFVNDDGEVGNSAPFPSMVVVFGNEPCFKTMLRDGTLM